MALNENPYKSPSHAPTENDSRDLLRNQCPACHAILDIKSLVLRPWRNRCTNCNMAIKLLAPFKMRMYYLAASMPFLGVAAYLLWNANAETFMTSFWFSQVAMLISTATGSFYLPWKFGRVHQK